MGRDFQEFKGFLLEVVASQNPRSSPGGAVPPDPLAAGPLTPRFLALFFILGPPDKDDPS